MSVATGNLYDVGRATVFLSLLPPSSGDRRLALWLMLASAVVFVLLLPFVKTPLISLAGFIPGYQSALFFSDLVTAAVLFGQFSIHRTRGLLVLATAYLFTALAIVPYTLSFPGLFSPSGLGGAGPQTTVWLYVAWHSGFPLMVIAYAFVHSDERLLPSGWSAAGLAAGAALAVVIAATLVTTIGHSLLPMLLFPDNNYTPTMIILIPAVWTLNFVALGLLWLRRPHNTLDLWLMVVMVAWIGDVGLGAALNAKRFDLGFYAGRAYGLVAATFILTMLLLETRALFARVALDLTSERDSATRHGHRIFETSQDIILVTDGFGKITQLNPIAEKTLGYRPEEMIGRMGGDFIFPADLDLTRDEMRTARRGKAIRDFRCRYVHKNGLVVPLVWTGVWSEPDRRHYFIGRDMTEIEAKDVELRQSQAMGAAADERAETAKRVSHETGDVLRAVVDASYQAIIALSPSGTVLLWNKAAERVFGYSTQEIVGKPYPRQTLNEEAASEQKELLARVMAGETLTNLAFRRQHKDGSERALHGAATPFYDASGTLRGAAYVIEDVTEKLVTEQMLRQAQKMEAVGQLTGGVAHDFNNILMVIQANIEELLEDDGLSDDQREMLSSVATSADRAAELTRRLLAFSRKQRLTPQSTNLTDLVSGIDKLLRRTLGEQIQIGAAFAEDLWTTNIDRSQVEAALVNLCVNARDAMPGGGRLLIEAANAEIDADYAAANPGVAAGQYVMLAVTDNGTGMPPEIVSRVFEPFFTTKEQGKGTGLGLSMVYGFIKQSNGHIKIYSELGHGTTIRMYLPRSDAAAEEEVKAAPVAPGNGERILLVEDEQQVRTAVLRQLRSLGYIVTEAIGGESALECLEAGQAYDLMLTDVIMPGLDGPSLVKVVNERWPGIKVLFMSGYSETAARSNGLVSPNARILCKPFRKVDLAARLREMLEG